jgi:hypothetical protein
LRCAVGGAGGIVRRLPDRVPSLAGIAHGEVEGSLGGRRRTAAGSRAWLGTGLRRGKTWEWLHGLGCRERHVVGVCQRRRRRKLERSRRTC